jgi:hypothetical protein
MNILKQLLQKVNSIGFWQRIFGWSSVKGLLVDAMAELQSLVDSSEENRKQVDSTKKELDTVSAKLSASESRISDLQRDKEAQYAELTQLRKNVNELSSQIVALRKTDETRQAEQQKAMSTLTSLQNRVADERNKELEAQKQEALAYKEKQKETWSKHQTDTKNTLKLLCDKHTIEYVDKVPFRGEPDNTLFICEEYVVFDAKSPATDDLNNFPTYLRGQAEAASKYAEKENVKSDIFFVVPTNTLEVLTHTVYEFPKHKVFIVSADSLEPIVLSLKKIEEYEFAEQLSPEDRQSVYRIIGRLAHYIKRRVQVDTFFSKEALTLSSDCETTLPPDILEEVIKIERAIRVNPPQERAGKGITIADLQKETRQVEKALEDRGILPSMENISKGINGVPLYKEEQ